jgi:hypothetical protein
MHGELHQLIVQLGPAVHVDMASKRERLRLLPPFASCAAALDGSARHAAIPGADAVQPQHVRPAGRTVASSLSFVWIPGGCNPSVWILIVHRMDPLVRSVRRWAVSHTPLALGSGAASVSMRQERRVLGRLVCRAGAEAGSQTERTGQS